MAPGTSLFLSVQLITVTDMKIKKYIVTFNDLWPPFLSLLELSSYQTKQIIIVKKV